MWEGNHHVGGPPVSCATDRFKIFIRDVLDFPQKGVLFHDITPLLSDKAAFIDAINEIAYLAFHY